MNQLLLESALDEIAPPLNTSERVMVGEDLTFLAQVYRARVEAKLPGAPPIQRTIGLSDGTQRLETSEERAAFFEEWRNRPRPGRPFNFAAWMLVYELRDTLQELRCHFGATKNAEGGGCRLSRLAGAVHRLSEVNCSEPDWQDLAEQSADEVTKIMIILGEGLVLPPRSDPKARQEAIAQMRIVLDQARVPEPKIPKRFGKRKPRHRVTK